MELHEGIEPVIAFNVGPMFADKTELLAYYALKYRQRGISVVVVRPSWDTRCGDPGIIYTRSKIVSVPDNLPVVVAHRGRENEIPGLVEGYEVVMIDECQMFRPVIVPHIRHMFWRGHRVIANLLDLTWEQRIFATAAACLSMREADKYWKSARCGFHGGCKHAAQHSQKLYPGGSPVPVFSGEIVDDPGDAEKYGALCWKHWLDTTPGAKAELARPDCRFFSIDPATSWE
jgi:thymidine kinase